MARRAVWGSALAIFKIVGGQIVAVEAMGAFLPCGTPSGWGG